MKLTTIWTIGAMTMSERIRRTRDWAAQKVAAALPRRVRYWSTIGDLAAATIDSRNVPATPLDEVMRKIPAPFPETHDSGADRG